MCILTHIVWRCSSHISVVTINSFALQPHAALRTLRSQACTGIPGPTDRPGYATGRDVAIHSPGDDATATAARARRCTIDATPSRGAPLPNAPSFLVAMPSSDEATPARLIKPQCHPSPSYLGRFHHPVAFAPPSLVASTHHAPLPGGPSFTTPERLRPIPAVGRATCLQEWGLRGNNRGNMARGRSSFALPSWWSRRAGHDTPGDRPPRFSRPSPAGQPGVRD